MARTRTKGQKKMGGIVKLKIIVERLQKSPLVGKKCSSDGGGGSGDDEFNKIRVPDDVKEGHFAVIAEDNDKLKRFIVPLSYLTHPSFLRLLEQAAEEYGFDHDGALTIPCRPAELQRILADQLVEEPLSTVDKWGSCIGTTMKSY